MARSILLFLVIFSSAGLTSKAQQLPEDEIIATQFLFRDSLIGPSSQLYLHTDKSVYTSNENIWFSAYLLRADRAVNDFHTLHVLLSHRITHKIAASGRFVINQGLSAGNFFIADSIPGGDYNLIAYTNAVSSEINPQVFQQQISIRYGGGDPFRIELKDDKSVTDSLLFTAHVTNKQLYNAAGASFAYQVYGDDRLLKKGNAVVSPFGEVPLAVSHDSLARKLDMRVIVEKEKTSLAADIPLPFLANEISFRWYPEGGEWVDGLATRTPFEVTDRTGKPVELRGQLLEDGVPVAKLIATSGMGMIQITPLAGKLYSIKLDNNSKKIVAGRIPEVKKKGVVITVEQAVTSDTLSVRLQRKGTGNNFFLLIHNYRQVFNFSPLSLTNPNAMLRIAVNELPVGLATFTLFDSALQPLAERTFFHGYDSLNTVRIIADSQIYHRRSKVQLKVKMQDASGDPVSGSFSVGAALVRRIDTTRFQDIVPYFYFREYEAMGIIPRLTGYGIGSRKDLETLLLIRCWTRYRVPAPDLNTMEVNWRRNLEISGWVKQTGRKSLKKPVSLVVFGGQGLPTVTTDSTGYFALPPEMTIAQPDADLHLVINEKIRDDFNVVFNRDVDSLNKELAALSYPESEGIKAIMASDEETLNKVQTLSTVVVKSSAREGSWGTMNTFNSTTCHDYVCMNNILNCGNHRNGTPAVEGGVYSYRGGMVTYHCPGKNIYNNSAEVMHKLKGRYYSKDFYVADYAEFNPPDPEKLSTIFWSQQVVTDTNGEAVISFYTNDLTGVFAIVLQGISENGVVSGRHNIHVIE